MYYITHSAAQRMRVRGSVWLRCLHCVALRGMCWVTVLRITWGCNVRKTYYVVYGFTGAHCRGVYSTRAKALAAIARKLRVCNMGTHIALLPYTARTGTWYVPSVAQQNLFTSNKGLLQYALRVVHTTRKRALGLAFGECKLNHKLPMV